MSSLAISIEADGSVQLATDELVVECTPQKGCDIRQIRDARNQSSVLWASPWTSPATPQTRSGDSEAENWLFHYPGGWQLLFPNAGAGGEHQGHRHRFHGEASIVAWEWERLDSGIQARVALFDTPFTIERRITLSGRTVRVEESITNTGVDRTDYILGHHPGFGSELLAGPTRLSTNGYLVQADDSYDPPGNRLQPGSRGRWPHVQGNDAHVDLRSPLDGGSCLAYLSQFPPNAVASIVRCDGTTGVELRWPGEIYPYAWLWQELGGSTGKPWFGRGHVIGVEPCTSAPASGIAELATTNGTQRSLDPAQTAHGWVELELLDESKAQARAALEDVPQLGPQLPLPPM